jgi:hypothetical protein
MDNQFRDRDRRSEYYDEPEEEESNKLLDYIYGGYKADVEKAEIEETEELKALASRDALKAYGFIRRQVIKLGALKRLTLSILGSKNVQIAATAVFLVVVGLSIFTKEKIVIPQDTSETLGATENSENQQILKSGSAISEGEGNITDGQGAIFDDSLEGASLKVIQQPFPPDISKDDNGINTLALSIPEKTLINRFETNKGQIYVVTRENNEQTVVFKHNDLLIFITANRVVSDTSWKTYVDALH